MSVFFKLLNLDAMNIKWVIVYFIVYLLIYKEPIKSAA